MDFQTFLSLWGAVAPLGVLAITLAAQRRKAERSEITSKAEASEVKALAAKLDLVEDRVIAVEGDIRHLPDKDVTHRLELAMRDMNAELKVMSEKLKPITAMADRIQDFAMEKLS